MAIATPPGAGALGIVRISGPDAVVIAGALCPAPAGLAAQPSHTLHRIRLIDPATKTPLDDALCAVMRAPHSYTGEDVVEFSCHGSPALLAMVVERLRGAGARLGEPGEFTRRAYVNRRLDLARAEAVALLIGARSERAVSAAARALAGELAMQVHRLREAILDLVAALEVTLDFPDDGVGIDAGAAAARAEALAHDAAVLVAAARRGRLVHEGVTLALVGRPNAGKSSLLNALLGYDRAIVTPVPGTTRDVVEGELVIAGVTVRVLDTAGLGDPTDVIDAEGMRRTRRALEASDVIVLMIDGSVPAAPDLRGELPERSIVVVRSKSDLPAHPRANLAHDALAVSARTRDGLECLRARLADEITRLVGEDGGDEGALAATLRQRAALEDIARALDAARAALTTMPTEVALVELRAALAATSDLLGIAVGDAVLDRIFATFCVGK